MTPQLTIRPATLHDVPQLAAIYDHHVDTSTATFEIEPPGQPYLRAKVESVTAANWPFLVAVGDHDEVLGYAYVNTWRRRPAYRFTVEDTIYLAPDAAGRGIGTRLLGETLRQAAQAGVREVVAVVTDSETSASRDLHTRLGFRTVGRLENVGYKFDRWLGATIMQKSLLSGEQVELVADDA